MDDILVPLLSFLGGVVITLIGWNYQKSLLQQQNEDRVDRLVRAMSILCSARIFKMLLAKKRDNLASFNDEKAQLTIDGDRYLEAIAGRSIILEQELDLYRRMNELQTLPFGDKNLIDHLLAIHDALETKR